MSKRIKKMQAKIGSSRGSQGTYTRIKMGLVPGGSAARLGLLCTTSIVAGIMLAGVGSRPAAADSTGFVNWIGTNPTDTTAPYNWGGSPNGFYLGSNGSTEVHVGSGNVAGGLFGSADGLYFSGGSGAYASAAVTDGSQISGVDDGISFIGGSGISGGLAYGGYFSAVSVDNEGVILGQNGDGIYIESAASVDINNFSGASITGGEDGIHITESGVWTASDDINISNSDATISGLSGDGIYILSAGDIFIDNTDTGLIKGSVDGIYISDAGNVDIGNGSGSTIRGTSGSGNGISIYSSGTVDITSSAGSVIAGESGGIQLDSVGVVHINNLDDSLIRGSGGDGIHIASAGAVTIYNSAASRVIGSEDGIDITDATGAINITNSGASLISGGANFDGIHVSSAGTVNIYNNSASTVEGGDEGIDLFQVGSVYILNSAGSAITGRSGDGINVSSAASFQLDNSAGSTVLGSSDGVDLADIDGTTYIYNSSGSSIKGRTDNAIEIDSAGDVNIYNSSGALIQGASDGVFGGVNSNYSGAGISIHSAGAVSINNSGGADIKSSDANGDAIHLGGNDSVYISNSGAGSEIWGRDTAIYVHDTTGSGVSIYNSGGASITGHSGAGIDVQSAGRVFIRNGSGSTIAGYGVDVDTIGGYGHGIEVDAIRSGGVTINNAGTITSDYHGIHIYDVSGETNINNYSAGSIFGSANAVKITNDSGGTVFINNSGEIKTSQSFYANHGPYYSPSDYASSGGTVFISGGSADVVINNYAGGEITNFASGGSAGTAARIAQGTAVHVVWDDIDGIDNNDVDIYNWGHIDGQVLLNNADNYFGNYSQNSWNVNGYSDFAGNGASGDVLDNSGGWINVFGDSTFDNLEYFLNSNGRINMQADDGDFSILDVQNSGSDVFPWYSGGAGAELAVDANMTSGGAHVFGGSGADLLRIQNEENAGGQVTGRTAVYVNDVSSSTATRYTPDGIPIVQLGSGAPAPDPEAFYLANGKIQKGLWQWDIKLATPDDGESISGDYEWQLAMEPGKKAAELPLLMSAAQDAWYSSTGLWLDRQADLRAILTGTGTMGGPAIAGGIWTKLLAGKSNREASVSYNDTQSAYDYGAQNKLSYDIGYDQSLFGFAAGADFGKQGSNGATWLFGLFGGYTQANNDLNSGASADLTSGNVGAYVTYIQGGWFVDGVLKGDFGSTDYSFNDGTNFDDSIGTTTIGGVVDMGYRYGFGGTGFLEPMASIAYAYTNMDDVDIQGSNVSFDDGSDFRGRLGLRAGISMTSGTMTFEPFVTASVWQDFTGDNSAMITSDGYNFKFSDDGVGTYGVFDGGINVYGGADWSGFAKVNYTYGGEDYDALSGSVGLRWNW